MISSYDDRQSLVLNSLPQQIAHTIFDFLWAHDILYSFHDISQHFNRILSNYQNYHINFKSILKRQFDLVCSSIEPNQITSLSLSDSDETPCQSKVYLSLFPIEQFTNLRAIKLFDIENKNETLFRNIRQLQNVSYFETDTLSHLWMIETIPRLKQLIVNKVVDYSYSYESLFRCISISNLRNLTLPHCSYIQLRQILRLTPKLTSLNISLIISDCAGIDYFAEQHQELPLMINRLNISIHTFTFLLIYIIVFLFLFIARTISRLLFERFLSRMPYIQQLELNVSSGGSSNLLEGNQWELFIQKKLQFLSIFNFKFKIITIDQSNYHEKKILVPFRSPFWLNRNPPWYVTYDIDNFTLYTVPRYVPLTTKHSQLSILPDSTTLPLEKYFIYYDRINELELDSHEKSSYQYKNVQRLILTVASIKENIIDLSKVEFLCVQSVLWPLKDLFRIIKTSMFRLHHLKIDFSFTLIELCNSYPLEQIDTLDLPQFSGSFQNEDYDLSYFFPFVERLTLRVASLSQISSIIDRFIYLSNGSFHLVDTLENGKHLLTENDICKWLQDKTTRFVKNNSFTYRLNVQSDVWIHLWMSSESKPQEKKIFKQISSSRQLMRLEKTNESPSTSRCCSMQ